MVIAAFIMGIIYSVPLGPLGQIMLNRAVTRGFWHGFSMGIIGAIANFFYCQIFLIGTSDLILNPRLRMAIQLFGLLFLLYVGFKEILLPNIFTKKKNKKSKNKDTPLLQETTFDGKAFFKTFLLVITYFIANPTAIAFWINMSVLINHTFIHHQNLFNYFIFSLAFALGTLACQYFSILFFKRIRQFTKTKFIAKYVSSSLFLTAIIYFFYITIQNIHNIKVF